MASKPKEPEGAKLVTKHPNGTVEEEILFRLNDNHPADPGGVGYWSTFTRKDSKKKK